MLGDPDLATSATMLDALVEGGADMIELGIPFSDPVADGPVIQAAAARALAAGVRTADCLDLIAALRSRHPDIPIGILTYANIVAARGIDTFAGELARAGVDSLLVADVPSIEAAPYSEAAKKAGIDLVMIAAPNTPPATLARIAALSSGYTYCVARAGDHRRRRGAVARPRTLVRRARQRRRATAGARVRHFDPRPGARGARQRCGGGHLGFGNCGQGRRGRGQRTVVR